LLNYYTSPQALMGDLKTENNRLQRLADILDSIPEITFCVDKDGHISYISDRSLNYIKPMTPDDSDDEPTHINQILTSESVDTVLECIAQIRAESLTAAQQMDECTGCVSAVKVRPITTHWS
jgi:PAS domain-containing protein